MATDNDKENFDVGDRVILHGLKSAAHLNNMHGTVATGVDPNNGRCQVDLDLLFPNRSNKRLNVKPSNLKSESPILQQVDDDAESSPLYRRAETTGGSLVETEGRAIDMVLNSARLSASVHVGVQMESFHDLMRLKTMGQQGLFLQNRLTASAWTYWNHRGEYKTNVYDKVVNFIRKEMPEANGGIEKMKSLTPFYNLCYDSVLDPVAVKGWNVRVSGNFYILGMDKDGTYLIPDTNHNVVYQCVGVCDPIYPKVQGKFPRTPCFHLTMIPWYGRLVYDGVLVMKGMASSPALDETLRENLAKAKSEGRVISRLLQLEVEGGSRVGVFDQAERTDDDASDEETEQKAPTEEEAALIDSLKDYPLFDGDGIGDEGGRKGGLWVMRRKGYTEFENKDHTGLILNDAHQVIGPFYMSALIPTSTDILQALRTHVARIGTIPKALGIDDMKCCARVRFLMKDVKGCHVYYYAPPTPEESAAAMASGDYEGMPGPFVTPGAMGLN